MQSDMSLARALKSRAALPHKTDLDCHACGTKTLVWTTALLHATEIQHGPGCDDGRSFVVENRAASFRALIQKFMQESHFSVSMTVACHVHRPRRVLEMRLRSASDPTNQGVSRDPAGAIPLVFPRFKEEWSVERQRLWGVANAAAL